MDQAVYGQPQIEDAWFHVRLYPTRMNPSRMEWSKLLCTERLKGKATAPDSPSSYRSAFQRDFDRIGYSLPFRRLQNKTQVHTLPNNDHVRNRLTHSLEASTIARSLATGIGRWLNETSNPDLRAELVGECAQAATLAHDIGNPPFGHPGEAAIQAWFENEIGKPSGLVLQPNEKKDFTSFNGNAQGFRILTQYCHGYDSPGLELTCATLTAFTKYPMGTSAGSTGHFKEIGLFSSDESTFALIAERIGLPRNLDGTWVRHPLAFLVEAADDIAYLTADIEDAVELGMIPPNEAQKLFRECAPHTSEPPCNVLSRLRSKLIGKLIDDSACEFKRDYECIISGQRHESLLKNSTTRERLRGSSPTLRGGWHVARWIDGGRGLYQGPATPRQPRTDPAAGACQRGARAAARVAAIRGGAPARFAAPRGRSRGRARQPRTGTGTGTQARRGRRQSRPARRIRVQAQVSMRP